MSLSAGAKQRASRGEGRGANRTIHNSGGMAAIFACAQASPANQAMTSSKPLSHNVQDNLNRPTKVKNNNKNIASTNISANSKSNIDSKSQIEVDNEASSSNAITTSNPTQIAQSNHKTDPRDRLSSMFDGNQENSKSILRVNLIKKSNRQPSILLKDRRAGYGINRKPLQLSSSPQDEPHSPQMRTIMSVVTSSSPSPPLDDIMANASNDDTRAKNGCQNSELNSCNKIDNPSIKGSGSHSKLNYSSQYDEAKRSQKLVVSLIKDISKTVSREDLDEILKEIHSALGEAQQKQQSDATERKHTRRQDNFSVNGNTRGDSNAKAINKKKSNQILLEQVKKVEVANHSDASNSSELKEEMNYYDDESSLDNEFNFNLVRGGNKKHLNDKISIKETLGAMLGSDSTGDINRQNLRRQLMDLSSDDDTSKDRKPNSSRMPARCLRITSSHAKYISPHRKRSLEERLSRAQEAREKLLEDRANKFREIIKKVEEMKAWKEEDTMNLKASVQTKQQKAAAKRKEQLDKIIKKAHDEDSKVSEIQFINNLEAQNRRHDMNSRKKEFEARLQDLQDERQRKLKEKAQAKEMAAEERRKNLEAERKAKLLEIQQRRRLKNQQVEQQQQVREKRRIEKNRDREQKIVAIKEAYNAGVQTLKKRINQKQEQSERRHEVNLRLIRQKAFELSIKRYNSFISESNLSTTDSSNTIHKQKESSETRRLQLKPFNTKKFCNLCKETISSELALFSHLRSDVHYSSINEHYGNAMLTTNEAVEIHNLRHIVDTDEPLDSDKGTNSDDQSSRASSLVNYYHSSHLSQANGGICMSESDRKSLLAIEKKCRKLRHKLIVAGKPFNRDWFSNKIRARLAQLLIQQRIARNQTTNTEATSLANTIDLSANNVNCQQNKPFYLKINRITRELVSVTTDQRISGGGLMPAGIIHSVDRLLADLNKQLNSRKVPQLSRKLLHFNYNSQDEFDPDQLSIATKMIESHAIDTLFLYDIASSLVSILRRIVPNVSLTSKLPTTVASHYSTLIDPISLNSYYCHRSPVLPARIYIKMIGFIQSLCNNHSDLCYIIFQSNNMINLSDILSYRLGFIIGNESPASSISGSSSAATLSAQTIDNNRKASKQQQNHSQPGNSYNGSKSSQLTSGKFQTSVSDDCCAASENEQSGAAVTCATGARSGDSIGQDEEENDGELWERAETYKRTEEIVDDMTASLCKLLATVTETILSRPLVLLNQLDKTAFDQRSDDFISYMVSVGIVDTESVIMSHIHQQQHHHLQQQQQNQNQQQTLSSSSSNISNMTATFGASQQPEKCSGVSSTDTFGHGMQSTTTPATIDASGAASAVAQSAAGGQPSVNMTSLQATNSVTNAACATLTTPVAVSSSSTTASAAAVSTSNKIVNFTTSCIQFVTSLVKLVTAKLPELDTVETTSSAATTTTLVQQDPTQLLATLKMTQLSGVLTLVYDMLVHSFDSLAQPPTQTHAAHAAADPQAHARQLGLALHSLRLINYVAYIDIELLQATLAADEMLPLQLRHVCSYLISYLVQSQFQVLEVQSACNGGELNVVVAASAANGDFDLIDLLKNELMNEIILLLGNFAYLNQDNQLMLKSGRRPTIIEQLIGLLPFDYFSRDKLKAVLMPTLISCAYSNDQICSLICQELSLSMLTAFIEDQLLASQLEIPAKQPQSGKIDERRSLVADELTSTKLASSRWRFERRFAKSKWLSAKRYFESQQAKMRIQLQDA